MLSAAAGPFRGKMVAWLCCMALFEVFEDSSYLIPIRFASSHDILGESSTISLVSCAHFTSGCRWMMCLMRMWKMRRLKLCKSLMNKQLQPVILFLRSSGKSALLLVLEACQLVLGAIYFPLPYLWEEEEVLSSFVPDLRKAIKGSESITQLENGLKYGSFWSLFWSTASGVGGLLGPASRSGFPCVCHKMDQQKHRSQIPENQDSGFHHRWRRHQSISPSPENPKGDDVCHRSKNRWIFITVSQTRQAQSFSPEDLVIALSALAIIDVRDDLALSVLTEECWGIKCGLVKVGGKHDSLVHFNTCLDLSLKWGPFHWRFTSRF